MRRAVTSPALDRIARCDDMVFCGTASALAMSPAASSFRLVFRQQPEHIETGRLSKRRQREDGFF